MIISTVLPGYIDKIGMKLAFSVVRSLRQFFEKKKNRFEWNEAMDILQPILETDVQYTAGLGREMEHPWIHLPYY